MPLPKLPAHMGAKVILEQQDDDPFTPVAIPAAAKATTKPVAAPPIAQGKTATTTASTAPGKAKSAPVGALLKAKVPTKTAAAPVVSKPVAAQPTAQKPVNAQQVASKPVATKPVNAKPVATKPALTKPQATKAAPAPSPAAAQTPTHVQASAAVPAYTAPVARGKKKARLPVAERKLFVLDTNVLLHDSNSLFNFQEHDIFLPMIVLEELDHQKKGMSEVARNARQVSRFLDALVGNGDTDLTKGLNLDSLGNIEALGQLHFQTSALNSKLPIELPLGKADNIILNVVHALQAIYPKRQVVLVSKDINIRLKARSLGLPAEDYLNDHVLDDSDLLYDGVMQLPENFWAKHGKDIESWQQGGITYYRIKGPLCADFMVNQFVYFEGEMPLYAQVKEVSGKSAVLATVRDYSHGKNNVWGITARNREQNFALNLLMNPDCDFVSLLGQAGTGKTLLALASALTQTLETKRYNEIIITRATVPVGDDIGFLPGTEEEKMMPWMGALEDNLEVLHLGSAKHSTELAAGPDSGRNATLELIRSRIKVKSLNFMRGRTFLNKLLIIDEAQNLTPKQMKTLVTRAGPGTKIICLGNIAQIDTPYLTEGSSGLTYVVDRFKGWPHAGHVTLQRGERSRLADYASQAL